MWRSPQPHQTKMKTLAFSLLLALSFTAAAQKVDLVNGQNKVAQVCAACHGPDGNATGAANPKLAGQHAEYLYKQLSNFKVKPGATEPERANAVMGGMAATLNDQDMHDVAAYFESQTLKPASGKGDKDSQALGQKIYRGGIAEKGVAACASCHGPTGAGIPVQFPRLGGQWAEYTELQLTNFRQGVRKNSVQMVSIAARLSDKEIKAVADYIAALR
jgi:cytochrome c553